ncbi:MAG: poly granule associated protein [Comamonadaceae bacterium CG1_02_60_18]|nr:MAG: poly granule associated protein [Comamonadaceae bacterium CG1_02_60_18]PIQ55556.1 MAG: poly granule associated protein [Comamonadaceae bacterium CG12_big_fil_rev_8_21_14_0_65_59_15]
MVTKLKKSSPSEKPTATPRAGMPLANSVKDSAQQIWQAGLGAFTKAQTEGTKAFEALVKEGVSFQRKTQSAAEEKITEATQKMTSMASDISSKASGQWDKLENIFEDRVAKALNKLGVPSAKDINALIARIDALNASVQKLAPKPPKAAGKSAPKAVAEVVEPVKAAPKTVAKKTVKPAVKQAVKKATPRKAASAKQPAAVQAGETKVNPS